MHDHFHNQHFGVLGGVRGSILSHGTWGLIFEAYIYIGGLLF